MCARTRTRVIESEARKTIEELEKPFCIPHIVTLIIVHDAICLPFCDIFNILVDFVLFLSRLVGREFELEPLDDSIHDVC